MRREEGGKVAELAEPTAVKVYGAAEFEATVLARAPQTAVFDCDGTLWGGDAGYGFMVWSLAEGLVSRDASDWIDSRYRQYRAGEVSELAMCGEMAQLYCGLRDDEMRAAARVYFRTHVESKIFPQMAALVERLAAAGAQIWAVSSTNHWVIEEGVTRFGIALERVLCARVRIEQGVATAHLLAVPTDEYKASALVAAGLPQPDAVFGNSIHDAAMLSIAAHAYPVNPTPGLVEVAGLRGWPVFYPGA